MEKFTTPDPEPETPAAPKPAAKPTAKPTAKPAEPPPATDEEADPEAAVKPADESKPGEQPKQPEGKRESPWKLVDTFKNRAIKAEKELADVRAAQKPGELPKEALDKFTALETRNKELEEEIRHVNYAKSKEYVEKYQQPFEDAWAEAISEVKQLKVANEDGTTRPGNAYDIQKIANLPTGEARELAETLFGKCAEDVMQMRKDLIKLSQAKERAIEVAKKNGGEREAQASLEEQARRKAQTETTAKLWADLNHEFVSKHEFLRPVEGQEERNQKLEQATKFVDETFGLNVSHAQTEQERQEIIKRHAALRSRAIGYSVLRLENKSLRTEVESLKKALSEFQGSEPTGGEPADHSNGDINPETLDGAVAGLARLAS